jgi:hypothetical protein
LIIWLIFFLLLQTKQSFSPLFAWSQLDIYATSKSVSAVSEAYQINYCWILKLQPSGPRIFKLLNLCGYQLISISELLMSLFLLFLGENIPAAEFGMISAFGRNCLLGHRKKIAKFLMRTFTCRSNLPLWCTVL